MCDFFSFFTVCRVGRFFCVFISTKVLIGCIMCENKLCMKFSPKMEPEMNITLYHTWNNIPVYMLADYVLYHARNESRRK